MKSKKVEIKIKRVRTNSFTLADLIYAFTSLAALLLIYLSQEKLVKTTHIPILDKNLSYLTIAYTLAVPALSAFLYFTRKGRVITLASLLLLTFPIAPIAILIKLQTGNNAGVLITGILVAGVILFCAIAIAKEENGISNVWVKLINHLNEAYSIITYSLGLIFAKMTLDNYNDAFKEFISKILNSNTINSESVLFALAILLSAQPITKIVASKKELDDIINIQKETLASTLRFLILDKRKILIKELGLASKFSEIEILLLENLYDSNNNLIQERKAHGALMAIDEIQELAKSHSKSHEYINEIGRILEEYIIVNSYILLTLHNIPDRQPPQAAPFDSMVLDEQLELVFSAYMRNQLKEHIKNQATSTPS